MEALEAIFTRKSVREYTPQVIPEELVQELLAAAMQAPSAGNQQPWHFITINEREKLTSLAAILPYGKMLLTAPLGIVICADLAVVKHAGYWVQDCSAATENLLLAAHAQGLGAVWIGVYPVEDRVTQMKQELGLPEEVVPLCVVSLGYPGARDEIVARRYNKSRVHINQW